MSLENLEELRAVASEIATREGVELYDLEFVGCGGNRTLRVTIDVAGRPISVDDCANVSRGLDLILDVKNLIPGGRYELEVSSPGIERPLKTRRHFETAIGQKIRFHSDTAVPVAGANRHSIEGRLKALEGDQIHIELDTQEALNIPLEQVRKAKVLFEQKTK